MSAFAEDEKAWNELLRRIGSGEPTWVYLEFGPNGIVVCGDTGDPSTLVKDLAALRERERAVRAVARKDLRATRRDCLREIRRGMRDAKRYFGRSAK